MQLRSVTCPSDRSAITSYSVPVSNCVFAWETLALISSSGGILRSWLVLYLCLSISPNLQVLPFN